MCLVQKVKKKDCYIMPCAWDMVTVFTMHNARCVCLDYRKGCCAVCIDGIGLLNSPALLMFSLLDVVFSEQDFYVGNPMRTPC